jgi:DNA polymerase III subunit delta'
VTDTARDRGVLPPILDHVPIREALARAAASGELPGALLFHGPAGIGKQRLALWLGQLLLCDPPAGDAAPCARCAHCRLTTRLEHPDLHWFFPLPRPKASGGPEKLAEALEEVRAAELAARRKEPYRPLAPREMAGLFLAQMQTVRRIAQARPAMARAKVIVIGDAERLVPQESSPEAANALLKLLEEPPPATTLILTAADSDALLPTIRSRLLPVRIQPLPAATLEEFLTTELAVPTDTARTVAHIAQGSLGAALAYLSDGGEPGPLEVVRQQARTWLDAATSPASDAALALALNLPPSGARGTFSESLTHLAQWLRDLAAVDAAAEEVVVNVDGLPGLRKAAARLPGSSARISRALARVETVAHWTQININPQLALAWLLRGLRRDLGAGG